MLTLLLLLLLLFNYCFYYFIEIIIIILIRAIFPIIDDGCDKPKACPVSRRWSSHRTVLQ
jgi:hypothetical protein